MTFHPHHFSKHLTKQAQSAANCDTIITPREFIRASQHSLISNLYARRFSCPTNDFYMNILTQEPVNVYVLNTEFVQYLFFFKKIYLRHTCFEMQGHCEVIATAKQSVTSPFSKSSLFLLCVCTRAVQRFRFTV